MQIAYDELPCPLCLLQRVAFTALAVGPVLTLRHGPRPAHYGLVIIAALMGAAIAARQILLHIMPGDAGYGSALLGLSLLHLGVPVLCRGHPAAAIMLLVRQAVRAGGERSGARHLRGRSRSG